MSFFALHDGQEDASLAVGELAVGFVNDRSERLGAMLDEKFASLLFLLGIDLGTPIEVFAFCDEAGKVTFYGAQTQRAFFCDLGKSETFANQVQGGEESGRGRAFDCAVTGRGLQFSDRSDGSVRCRG